MLAHEHRLRFAIETARRATPGSRLDCLALRYAASNPRQSGVHPLRQIGYFNWEGLRKHLEPHRDLTDLRADRDLGYTLPHPLTGFLLGMVQITTDNQ